MADKTADQTARQGFRVAADLARLPEIVAADLAPDGGSTVYAATTRDGRTVLERTLLWRHGPDGTDELLADSDADQGAPAFSPDGTRIAYLRGVDGKPQVAVLNLADRTSEVLTGFARGVCPGAAPRWSPDGTTLAFTASDAPVRDPRKPYRVTRPVWRRDGLGLVEDVKGDLWTVPAAGGTPTRLTFHDGIVGQVQWSPDGTSLLYDCFAEPSTTAVTLRTISADGTRTHIVLNAGYLVYPPAAAWLSDGRIVRTTGWDVYKRLDLAVYDPATGTETTLGVTLPGQLGGMMQMAMNSALFDGARLVVDHTTNDVYLYVQTGGRLELARVSTLDGWSEIVYTGDFSVAPVVLRGTKLLLAHTSFGEPVTPRVFDVADRTEVPASALDRGWLGEAPFTVRELHFEGADGTPVEGWFLEPRVGSGPYPTVLNIHGGPFAVYGHSFSVDNHLFTSSGYGVLLVNYRGSSGYGEDFARSLIADWGHNDAGDLLAGVDHAVSLGLVDPARLGSFGLSGGGYLTSWLLTHDNRFAAGIAECPVTDWNGMVGSDIPQLVGRWMDEEPGRGPDSMVPYVRMSPATYAADCVTPMLIVEHEGDLRCPSGQGDVFYNALHLAGRTVEMLRLPGMFHGGPYQVPDLAGRIERLAALTEWFDRYLKI